LLINDFVNPTIRKANYRKGVMGSEEKA
jgi:hypothetical protein